MEVPGAPSPANELHVQLALTPHGEKMMRYLPGQVQSIVRTYTEGQSSAQVQQNADGLDVTVCNPTEELRLRFAELFRHLPVVVLPSYVTPNETHQEAHRREPEHHPEAV